MRAIADDGVDQVLTVGFDERWIRHGAVLFSEGAADRSILLGEPYRPMRQIIRGKAQMRFFAGRSQHFVLRAVVRGASALQ
jgi:hypothetical protein